MACLRGRVVAGNGRWVHASTVAMPVPLRHRGVPGPGPGRPLSNVRESWPKSARSRPAERHRRARGGSQQTCTSGTRFAQNRHGRLSAASSAAVLRRRRSRSWCLLRAIPRSRTRQDDALMPLLLELEALTVLLSRATQLRKTNNPLNWRVLYPNSEEMTSLMAVSNRRSPQYDRRRTGRKAASTKSANERDAL